MNKPFTVVVDADAIVATAYTRDLNHDRAARITQKLAKKDARFLYPVTSIAEAVTVLQRKLNNKRLASMTAEFFTNRDLDVIGVDQETLTYAIRSLFIRTRSKKQTLFDCLVVSVAEKYEADAIFSFDKFYKKLGFRLALEV